MSCTCRNYSEDVTKKLNSMHDAEFIIHPECSCTTPMMYDVADGSYNDNKVSILSTFPK